MSMDPLGTAATGLEIFDKYVALLKKVDETVPDSDEFVTEFDKFVRLFVQLNLLAKDNRSFLRDCLKDVGAELKNISEIPNESTIATLRRLYSGNNLKNLSEKLASKVLIPLILTTYYKTERQLSEIHSSITAASAETTTAVNTRADYNTERVLSALNMIEDVVAGNKRVTDYQVASLNFKAETISLIGLLQEKAWYSELVPTVRTLSELDPESPIGRFASSLRLDANMSVKDAVAELRKRAEAPEEHCTSVEEYYSRGQQLLAQQPNPSTIQYGRCKYSNGRVGGECTCMQYTGNGTEMCTNDKCKHSTVNHMNNS